MGILVYNELLIKLYSKLLSVNIFFYFLKYLQIYRRVKDSSHLLFTQLPLMLIFYITMIHLSKLRKLDGYNFITRVYSDLIIFPLIFFH